MNTLVLPASLALVTLALAACDPAELPDGAPAGACPAPRGPTVHSGDRIADDETWTAEGSPHIVESFVEITEAARLTVEPCAEVQFAENAGIGVAYIGEGQEGALIAEGTEERPIRLAGKDGARWVGVLVQAPGTATLRHVTIEGASGDSPDGEASLVIHGDMTMPVKKPVLVDHVTIKDSISHGVEVNRMAGFADGSTELVVTGSGLEQPAYPLVVSEHALDSIPTGQYTGNARDEIRVIDEGAGRAASGIQTDATVRDRGVPYIIGSSEGATLIVGGTLDGSVAKLTIEPGVVLRFVRGASLSVELFSTEDPATGVLHAVGTPDKPIVFTSAEESPAAGDWMGIWFGSVFQPENRIEHARIEYAGSETHSILLTCNEPGIHEGGVILTTPPPSQFIQHTTFAHITGHGVHRGWRGPSAPDFADTNTFEDLTGCAVSTPPDEDLYCPEPPPTCP
ncbi:putative secreted protein [Sorangium cellulosum So ce56]|uniref:Secreted protein n=1 Tax=Sorangium cellulosum (strain So ce56) TaxID=448385 RepID=A9GCY2_SORC5|nr:hypothetical protein [Sorangium cellulosum]CAN99285.1 putative secreted protein [Sorangium cellulosum So ce56]